MKPLIIPIFIPNQGCPNFCIFCNQKKISGVTNPPNQKNVREIIKTYLATYQEKKEHKKCHRVWRPDAIQGSGRSPDLPSLNNSPLPTFIKGGLGGFFISLSRPEKNFSLREAAFYGGSFTALDMNYQKELLEVAKHELDQGLIDGIRISTRPDYIDDKRLKTLKAYGVKTIELGVQSFSDTVLENSKRGHNSSSVAQATELIKKFGFSLGIQLMMGLPGDNEDSLRDSVKKTIDIKPDFVRIYPVLILKKTELEKLYYEGEYNPLSLEEIIRLGKEMLKKFYSTDIPVIRFGLQPTDTINLDNYIIAGPYHPSLRHIIDSEIAFDKMVSIIEVNHLHGKSVGFSVPEKELSVFKGLRGENIQRLKKTFKVKEIYFNS